MNGPSSSPQMPSSTEMTSNDPVIGGESSDAVTQLRHHERTAVDHRRDHPHSTGDHLPSTGDHLPSTGDHLPSMGDPRDHPPSTGDPRDHPSTRHRPLQPPPPSYPVELAPSPLMRSASAPPDYVPSPSASRQHRATRSHWTTSPEDDFRLFQMPPEVVETRRRPKECSACCLRCIVVMTTLRWLFVMAALLGAGCVVTGIVFGVMSSTLNKNAFFVLAFTFIGLGIVLVLVVGIGWRCSPAGHEPCHALCHLAAETPSSGGGTAAYDTGTQRGATRLMHRSRNQWYAGFLYPEFHYATPPPSYSISMQQYRQQVVQQQCAAAVDRDRSIIGNSSITSLDNLSSLPSSPPPTYRSRIVGRVRPPLSGVMIIAGDATSAELPPPYQNSSTASSLDRLADVEEREATGSLDTVLGTPDVSEVSTDNDQHPVSSDPSDLPMEEGGIVVLEPLATPTTHVATPTTHVIIQSPMTINASTPSVPDGKPEVLPSVRNIVHRFENFVNVPRTIDVSERTCRSLSDVTESTDQGAGSQADQSHSRNTEDDNELCSVSQTLKVPTRNNQSNVRISGEASCSSFQSSNVRSVNNQSHLRLSTRNADSRSINLLPATSTTANQISKARPTTTKKSFGIVGHSQPTSFQNVTNNAHAANQSSSEASQQPRGPGQSPDDRPIQILPAANRFHASSNGNQSYRDFGRSQSLNGPEIGESGI